MIALLMVLGSFGFEYDGYENGKYYFSILTLQTDYGIVVSEEEICVDTIFERVEK